MKPMTTIRGNTLRNAIFAIVGLVAMLVSSLTLIALLASLAIDGSSRVSWHFFSSFPSRFPAQAGIFSAWVGTSLVMAVTACTAIPLGIAAAVYLEEYGSKNWMTDLIEINIANLAGVPSIVYGLMALGLFVYEFHLGSSILTAGLTLSLLILPMVIMTTREAIRTSPRAYAKPPSRWARASGKRCTIMSCPTRWEGFSPG
jgi:phosphate transport system permease protein